MSGGLPGLSHYQRHHGPTDQGKWAQGSNGFGVHLGTLQGGDGGWPNTTAEAAAVSQPITTLSRELTGELPLNSLTERKERREDSWGLPASPQLPHQQVWLPAAVSSWQQFKHLLLL